jgi:hypothetical protein
MLYTGITRAVRKYESSKLVKVVVDASSNEEALEVANSYIESHNARVAKAPLMYRYQPFTDEAEFSYTPSHPTVAIIHDLKN